MRTQNQTIHLPSHNLQSAPTSIDHRPSPLAGNIFQAWLSHSLLGMHLKVVQNQGLKRYELTQKSSADTS